MFYCLSRFYQGDWGDVPTEDKEANDNALTAGEGRIVARYPKSATLQNDVYLIAYFSESNPGDVNYNNITVMYVNEY